MGYLFIYGALGVAALLIAMKVREKLDARKSTDGPVAVQIIETLSYIGGAASVLIGCWFLLSDMDPTYINGFLKNIIGFAFILGGIFQTAMVLCFTHLVLSVHNIKLVLEAKNTNQA